MTPGADFEAADSCARIYEEFAGVDRIGGRASRTNLARCYLALRAASGAVEEEREAIAKMFEEWAVFQDGVGRVLNRSVTHSQNAAATADFFRQCAAAVRSRSPRPETKE